MSYRFYLFDAGEQPDSDSGRAWLERQEAEALANQPRPNEAPAWSAELEATLLRTYSDLTRETPMPAGPFARLADSRDGVEISMYAASVVVTLPLWHAPDTSLPVLRRVLDYLAAVAGLTGFVAYDPQLDRILRLPDDLTPVVQRYDDAVRSLRRYAGL